MDKFGCVYFLRAVGLGVNSRKPASRRASPVMG